MKFKLALVAASLLSAFGAQAGIVTLDDFSINQALIAAPPLGSSAPAGPSAFFSTRTLSFTAATGSATTNQIEVSAGQLFIAAGPNSTSTSVVSWNLNLTALAALGATYAQVTIDQVSIDAGQQVTVGGGARTNATNGTAITLFSGAPGAITNPFAVTFLSALNADSVWDNVKLTFSCRAGATSITAADLTGGSAACPTTTVPEPGSMALLGLGLLGAVALRRKSK